MSAHRFDKVERIARKARVGEEPSLVDEYAIYTVDERLEMFLRLRQRVIEDRYGTDPGFERFHSVARRA
jgi:hypothetical protein